MERETYVRLVEDVGELDGVASARRLVDLVLGDELGAVEVVLLGNERLGRGEDLRVRVGDPREVSGGCMHGRKVARRTGQ